MVGQGQRGKLERLGPLHQLLQPGRAVEETVLGVDVQMDEVGVFHSDRLPVPDSGLRFGLFAPPIGVAETTDPRTAEGPVRGPRKGARPADHSHSMVLGGLEEMS